VGSGREGVGVPPEWEVGDKVNMHDKLDECLSSGISLSFLRGIIPFWWSWWEVVWVGQDDMFMHIYAISYTTNEDGFLLADGAGVFDWGFI